MKKLVFCLFICAMGYNVHAQRFSPRYETGWMLSVGVNAVGNLGTRNPVGKLDQFAFKNPLAVAIENRWSKDFSIEQDISLNGFNEGEFLDNGVPSKNFTYFSTNTNVKWYFSDYLYDADWIELYAAAGVGIFHMDELNTSGNLSGGVLYWFSDFVGARLQTTGKIAVNAKNRQFDNNHWQHTLQVIFRL